MEMMTKTVKKDVKDKKKRIFCWSQSSWKRIMVHSLKFSDYRVLKHYINTFLFVTVWIVLWVH